MHALPLGWLYCRVLPDCCRLATKDWQAEVWKVTHAITSKLQGTWQSAFAQSAQNSSTVPSGGGVELLEQEAS
jgi:hypothetical protein